MAPKKTKKIADSVSPPVPPQVYSYTDQKQINSRLAQVITPVDLRSEANGEMLLCRLVMKSGKVTLGYVGPNALFNDERTYFLRKEINFKNSTIWKSPACHHCGKSPQCYS